MSFISSDVEDRKEFELEYPIYAIFILGGPGAGKGTQCAKLVSKFSNIVTLSTGNLLRQLKKSGTPEGDRIAKQMAEGKLVDINATERLLKPEFLKHQRQNKMNSSNNNSSPILFIIDGFPRDLDILKDWQNSMKYTAIVPFMIEFVCDSQTMKQRLINRQNKEMIKRNDNNIKAIENRIALFENETQVVISEFKKMNKYRGINAKQNENEVFKSLCKLIEPVLNDMKQSQSESDANLMSILSPSCMTDVSMNNLSFISDKMITVTVDELSKNLDEFSLNSKENSVSPTYNITNENDDSECDSIISMTLSSENNSETSNNMINNNNNNNNKSTCVSVSPMAMHVIL